MVIYLSGADLRSKTRYVNFNPIVERHVKLGFAPNADAEKKIRVAHLIALT
jgi:hypothetical protein